MVVETMDVEKAIKKIIRKSFGEKVKVIKFEIESGTKKGENYGSDLLFINTTLQKGIEKERQLNLVAKRLPPTEYLRDVFNVKVSFPKEAAFYQKVLPEYIKLQKESGFNEEECTKAFPEFIGALFGPNGEVSEETTLLMENIKPNGYRLASRLEGLDLEHCKIVMKEIAMFHALGIALKRRKPDIFDSAITKNAGRPFKEGADIEKLRKDVDTYCAQLLDYVKTLDGCAQYVSRLSSALNKHFFYSDAIEGYKPSEPFCTFVHNDLWVNNVMFNYDKTGSPKSVKLIDFQTSKVGSPASDIIHFLYLSTTLDVLSNNFDELVKLYHNCFYAALKRLGVDSEEFNWENFCREFEENAQKEVTLALCMLRVVKTEQDFDLDEVSLDTFAMNFDKGTENRNERWHAALVLDSARRGWI